MCKSFHSTGYCPYGTRCHFIHQSEDSHDRLADDSGSPAGSGGDFEELGNTLGSLSLG